MSKNQKIYLAVITYYGYYENEQDMTHITAVSNDINKLVESYQNKKVTGDKLLIIDESLFNSELYFEVSNLMNERSREGLEIHDFIPYMNERLSKKNKLK